MGVKQHLLSDYLSQAVSAARIHYKIPFNRPCFAGNEWKYIAAAIAAGQISGDGPFTKRCHSFLEREIGVKKAFLTTSCTHALEMAAMLLDIKPGDEIIAPAFTFVSTINACISQKADVCFAQFPVKKQALWKNFGSWSNGKIADKVIGKPEKVYLSPFKVIRGDVAKAMTIYDGPYPYVDGILFTVTRNVTQIPVDNHDRFQGKSNSTLSSP